MAIAGRCLLDYGLLELITAVVIVALSNCV